MSNNGALPTSWTQIPLGRICNTTSGGTPSRKQPKYYGGEIPWLKSGELNDSTVKICEETITESGLKNSSAKLFPQGTLLIALYGATVGKLGILGFDATTNQAICAILSSEIIETKYMFWFLFCQRNYLLNIRAGGAQPNISQQIIRELSVTLPPHNEQKRIVTKIEQLFSDLDAGIETLSVIKKQVRQYRQSVLKHAFEGKLTAEWRKKYKPESASKLLERIAKEKEQKHENKNQVTLSPLDTSDLPELPQGWEWAKLDDIADIKGGITKDQKKKYQDGRSIPYLRVANVQRGYLDLSEIKEIHASEDIIQSLLLEKGDILFTEGGDRDKLGRGCVWNNEIHECIHQNHIFRARLYSDQINSQVISWHGNTFGQIYFMKQGKQTTNLASINLTKLRIFPVPVIPPKEQEIMISEIERHFSIADKIDEVVETALKQSNRLRQSILKRAFEGRLVPQDPNDEPAEKLLERIRKEKI